MIIPVGYNSGYPFLDSVMTPVQAASAIKLHQSASDRSENMSTECHCAESAIRAVEALHGRLACYVQPLRPLSGQALAQPQHHEALVRVFAQDGRLLSTADFIRACEGEGSVSAVDAWMVERVCEHLACTAHTKTTYSVNVSRVSIRNHRFIKAMQGALRRYRIQPERLCVEITETAWMGGLVDILDFVRRVHSMGIKVSVDDVGAGFTTIGNLRRLDMDYLKFDMDFVSRAAHVKKEAALLKAIQGFTADMGIQTVAEGIETQSLLDQMTEIGIDYAQGFLVGKPIPL